MLTYSTDRFGRIGDGDVMTAALDQDVAFGADKNYLVVTHSALGMAAGTVELLVNGADNVADYQITRRSPTVTIVKRLLPGAKTLKARIPVPDPVLMYKDTFSNGTTYATDHTPDVGARGTAVVKYNAAGSVNIYTSGLRMQYTGQQGQTQMEFPTPELRGFDLEVFSTRPFDTWGDCPRIGLNDEWASNVVMRAVVGQTTQVECGWPGGGTTIGGLSVPQGSGYKHWRMTYDGANIKYYYDGALIHTRALANYTFPAGYISFRGSYNSSWNHQFDNFKFWAHGPSSATAFAAG